MAYCPQAPCVGITLRISCGAGARMRTRRPPPVLPGGRREAPVSFIALLGRSSSRLLQDPVYASCKRGSHVGSEKRCSGKGVTAALSSEEASPTAEPMSRLDVSFAVANHEGVGELDLMLDGRALVQQRLRFLAGTWVVEAMRADVWTAQAGPGSLHLGREVAKPRAELGLGKGPLRDARLDRHNRTDETCTAQASNRGSRCGDWFQLVEAIDREWQDQRSVEIQEGRAVHRIAMSAQHRDKLRARINEAGARRGSVRSTLPRRDPPP